VVVPAVMSAAHMLFRPYAPHGCKQTQQGNDPPTHALTLSKSGASARPAKSLAF